MGKYVAISLLFFSVIAVFLLSHHTILAYDDFSYKFIFTESGVGGERIAGLSDLIQSQYNHYFVQNGRVFVHFLVQFFLIFSDKIAFEISNALVFGLLQILIFRYLLKSKRISTEVYLVFFALFWFLMPGLNYCLLWLSCSINYLWSTTMIIGFLLVFRKITTAETDKKQNVLMLILVGFFSGASQELITIPMSLSLLLLYLFRINRFRINSDFPLVVSFWLGTLFIALAPGNALRIVKNQVEEVTVYRLLFSANGLIMQYTELKLVILLLVVVLIGFYMDKTRMKALLRENFLLFSTLFFSLAFVLYLGYYRPRFFFPVSLFALIAIMTVLLDFRFSFGHKVIRAVSLALFVFFMIESVQAFNKLGGYKEKFVGLESEIQQTKDTVFATLPSVKTRFFCDGLGKMNGKFWINESMAKYYHKQSIQFLPDDLYRIYKGRDSMDKLTVVGHIYIQPNMTGKILLSSSGYFLIEVNDSLHSMVDKEAKLIVSKPVREGKINLIIKEYLAPNTKPKMIEYNVSSLVLPQGSFLAIRGEALPMSVPMVFRLNKTNEFSAEYKSATTK